MNDQSCCRCSRAQRCVGDRSHLTAAILQGGHARFASAQRLRISARRKPPDVPCKEPDVPVTRKRNASIAGRHRNREVPAARRARQHAPGGGTRPRIGGVPGCGRFSCSRGRHALSSRRPRGGRMIPAAKAKLLEGKKGLIVGIANDQLDRLGLRQGIPGVRGRARGHLSQRQGQEIRRAARPRARGADRHAARRAHARPDGGGLRTDRQGLGQPRFRRPLHRLLAQGRAAGARRRCVAGRLSHHHGRVLLDVSSAWRIWRSR